MSVALLQLTLSLSAGFLIFRVWRAVASVDVRVRWIIAAGFLIRAIGGIAAFWISYLRLPIARSLQLGNGLWLLALDAQTYFDVASRAASQGIGAIVFLDKTNASVFYTQTLATAFLLFGSVVATGLLLNVAAYVGCCAVIVHFRPGRQNSFAIIALSAVSLSPSAILWSLQPLKDVVFLFLVALFFAAAAAWQRFATRVHVPAAAVAGTTILMAATAYAIAGVRWYVGVMLLTGAVVFAALTVFRAQRRVLAAGAGVGLIVLSAAAVLMGAGPYLPPFPSAMLHGSFSESKHVPEAVATSLTQSRRAFESAGGATMIGAGPSLRQLDSETRVEHGHDAKPDRSTVAEKTALPDEPAPQSGRAAENAADDSHAALPAPMTSASGAAASAAQDAAEHSSRTPGAGGNSSRNETSAGSAVPVRTTTSNETRTVSRGAEAAPSVTRPPASGSQPAPVAPPQTAATSGLPIAHHEGDTQRPAERAQPAADAGGTHAVRPNVALKESAGDAEHSQPSEPARQNSRGTSDADRRERAVDASRSPKSRAEHRSASSDVKPAAADKPSQAVTQAVPVPAAPPQTAAAAPRPQSAVETPQPPSGGMVVLPASPLSRLIAGAAAVVLPRIVAQSLGLISIAGGRGLWIVVEIDTIIFDVVLITVLVALYRALSARRLSSPLFWLVFFFTGAMAVGLMYTVTNFGTLFRHRDMILLGLALLPLAAGLDRDEPSSADSAVSG
jgi:hypothetical protein